MGMGDVYTRVKNGGPGVNWRLLGYSTLGILLVVSVRSWGGDA